MSIHLDQVYLGISGDICFLFSQEEGDVAPKRCRFRSEGPVTKGWAARLAAGLENVSLLRVTLFYLCTKNWEFYLNIICFSLFKKLGIPVILSNKIPISAAKPAADQFDRQGVGAVAAVASTSPLPPSRSSAIRSWGWSWVAASGFLEANKAAFTLKRSETIQNCRGVESYSCHGLSCINQLGFGVYFESTDPRWFRN